MLSYEPPSLPTGVVLLPTLYFQHKVVIFQLFHCSKQHPYIQIYTYYFLWVVIRGSLQEYVKRLFQIQTLAWPWNPILPEALKHVAWSISLPALWAAPTGQRIDLSCCEAKSICSFSFLSPSLLPVGVRERHFFTFPFENKLCDFLF